MPASQAHARTPDEDNDLLLGMMSGSTAAGMDSQMGRDSETDSHGGDSEQQTHAQGEPSPSAVPPYWSFSSTRMRLDEEPRHTPPAALLPRPAASTAGSPSPSATSAGGMINNRREGSSAMAHLSSDSTITPSELSSMANAPLSLSFAPGHALFGRLDGAGSQRRQDGRTDVRATATRGGPANEAHEQVDDEDDPSKGLASGPNALPVSPPLRLRRLPHMESLLDGEESCDAGCLSGRCTCSRLSSPAPQTGYFPVASTSAQPDGSNGGVAPAVRKQKRKRDTSYIRASSFLQPGVVFTGRQSFTTYANSPTSPVLSAARRDITSDRHYAHPYAPVSLPNEHDRLYTGSAPSRHSLASALDRIQVFGRQATATSAAAQPQVASWEGPATAWSAISGSAIDPQMQDLLAGNPSYGYTSGDSIARASCIEEWEVQVSISSVDYVRGRVTGIMTAINVPNSGSSYSYNTHQPSTVGPSSASLASGANKTNTVTTSFEGEIIDMRNNGLWTRNSPSMRASRSSDRHMASEDEEDDDDMDTEEGNSGAWRQSLSTGSSSSMTGGPWLGSDHPVEKSTDLENWAKVEAFTAFGPLAEKEICRVAREGKWPEPPQPHLQSQQSTQQQQHGSTGTAGQQYSQTRASRRPNPQDYILMRWKERDFIDCDARTSGLTISGFYYLCLNRKTGALSGFYYDPLSTPHQKLDLQAARTRHPADPNRAPEGHGGVWFGTYSVL